MKKSYGDGGFSLIELLVGMVITLIVVFGATGMFETFYSGTQSAKQLANRVSTASMLTSVMNHTVGMQGYYGASTVSVSAIPQEAPTPALGSSIGPVSSITVYWLPSAATTSPYCSGTLTAVKNGMTWNVLGPSGCTSGQGGQVFYPVGAGWAFYLVGGTNCNNNQVQQTATAVVASNTSNNTEAVSCLGNT
jgi:prepilin-type N-terminal cleavage/methylation domain-containing protein